MSETVQTDAPPVETGGTPIDASVLANQQVAEQIPPAEIAAAEAPNHADTPSLLNTPPAEAAVVETPPAPIPEPDKPAEPPPEAVPPEPLRYEPPTLPEGVTLDPERIGAFDGVVGKHQLPTEARQELVDMYVAERRTWEQAALRDQQEAYARVRAGWRDQVQADEQIGGNGHDAALGAAIRMINEFVPEASRPAFNAMMDATGVGDHPEMIRLLHNIARKFDAPASPIPPADAPPDRGPGRGGARRLRDLYDNPRSHRS